MEDALAPTRPHVFAIWRIVLILVLMEDALAHFDEMLTMLENYKVLILVLMEDALAQQN